MSGPALHTHLDLAATTMPAPQGQIGGLGQKDGIGEGKSVAGEQAPHGEPFGILLKG